MFGGLASGPIALDEKVVRFVVRVLPIDCGRFRTAVAGILVLDRRRRYATLTLGSNENRLSAAGSQQGLVIFGSRRKQSRGGPGLEIGVIGSPEPQANVRMPRVESVCTGAGYIVSTRRARSGQRS